MNTISEKVAFQRLKRHLFINEGRTLRKCRNNKWLHDLGEYYTTGLETGVIIDKHVNVKVWAKEVGIMKDNEVLEAA